MFTVKCMPGTCSMKELIDVSLWQVADNTSAFTKLVRKQCPNSVAIMNLNHVNLSDRIKLRMNGWKKIYSYCGVNDKVTTFALNNRI